MITLDKLKSMLEEHGYRIENTDIFYAESQKEYLDELSETFHWLADDRLNLRHKPLTLVMGIGA